MPRSEKEAQEILASEITEKYPEDVIRPRTRNDCRQEPRPCPFVSCRYHLYLDTRPEGSIVINHPRIEPEDLYPSCALDVADVDSSTLEEIGKILNITRERVRQIEAATLRKLRKHGNKVNWEWFITKK